jgi:hypothetical protein
MVGLMTVNTAVNQTLPSILILPVLGLIGISVHREKQHPSWGVVEVEHDEEKTINSISSKSALEQEALDSTRK